LKRIAILGAGLTGLSAAYHLRNHYDMVGQECEAGGLCRTMKRNGFLFDYTGHLLHLRHEYTAQLVQRLLPQQYSQHSRKATIFLQEHTVNYPFQANIHSLPPEMIKECLLGFIETLPASPSSDNTPLSSQPVSFHDWALCTFGAGVARYFMFPYNRKLWRIPLRELAADWVSWSIPKPTLDEFLNGALGIKNRQFGYNQTFLYPKTGGVDQLPRAFLKHLPPDRIHYGKKMVALDAKERCLYFEDDSTYQYDTLISTIPLKQLVAMIHDVPEPVARANRQLRYISVYDLNIGVNRPNISDAHWTYFPEPEFPFYRVGFPTNFSDHAAPRGCSSIYVEVSVLPDQDLPEHMLREKVSDGLRRCGILRESDEILVNDVVRIECAYVLHDLNRSQALRTIFPYLRQHGLYSIGRYGAWEYSAMEDAILAGKQIAESVSQG
jgi:protoporphyrinogen oxidase